MHMHERKKTAFGVIGIGTYNHSTLFCTPYSHTFLFPLLVHMPTKVVQIIPIYTETVVCNGVICLFVSKCRQEQIRQSCTFSNVFFSNFPYQFVSFTFTTRYRSTRTKICFLSHRNQFSSRLLL